jgi:hypothetical protein
MSNFEHIDDYLTNRLNPEDKANFEKQLEADGALRADVEFQKLTIDAIKHARRAELKTMLNNVPVGGGGFSTGFTTARIAGGVVSVALIGSIAYFSLRDSKITEPASPVVNTEETTKPINPAVVPSDTVVNSIAASDPSKITDQQTTSAPTEKAALKKQDQPVSAFKEPKIDVLDLSDELTSDSKKEKALLENHKAEIAPSRVEVSTDSSNKKYAFHYQFNNGKLMLYGSFDKGLYEILEINGNSHNVFLFYQANYYLLEEKENITSPLVPVKDPVLLKKLKEYRTR